jgi:hypothetical protein
MRTFDFAPLGYVTRLAVDAVSGIGGGQADIKSGPGSTNCPA